MSGFAWGEKVAFIWSVKEILRDHYKRHEYGQVILPLAVIRRLDCVLEPTKAKVLHRVSAMKGEPDSSYDVLAATAGQQFYNTSKFTFESLLDDPENIADNLGHYLRAYSPNARDVIEKFDFHRHVERLDRSGVLYEVVKAFSEIDLHPDKVSNLEMGYIYEELVRVVADLSNEEAGDHFTPREVIALMVNLLLADDRGLETKGKVFKVYDPTCGTGGMLTEAEHRLLEINSSARVHLFGQEVAPESYAVCRSDMMLKGQDATNIKFGSTLTQDGFPGETFNFILANPPYGKDWKTEQKQVREEHEKLGYQGRFGPGLPGTDDGQMLFLLHMISKMRPADDGGSRVAVVLNGSPLFAGDAGSGGPNAIRRYLIENDLVEAIVGLPDQMFYNTPISTYVWVLTNVKAPERQGCIQLIDARAMYTKMGKSLGNKRNELPADRLAEITKIYESCVEADVSKVVPNEDFGYRKIAIDRPLRVRYELSAGVIHALPELTAVKKLADGAVAVLVEALTAQIGTTAETEADLKRSLQPATGLAGAPSTVLAAVVKACMVRDASAPPATDSKGRVLLDSKLREYERVPLQESIDSFMSREVLPFVADAVVSDEEGVIGYDVPFTKFFYRYIPPRPLAQIDAEIKASQRRILELIGEIAE